MYDNVCKFLAERFSQDFAQWLLGEPIGLTQLSPSELSADPIRADALILLGAEQVVLHLEFQTEPDPDMPFRMADYRLRVYRRYPNKPMRQVVIYLKPSGSAFVQQTRFEIPGTRHEFEVIRLWEVPHEDLLPYPGLLPLAVLGQTTNQTQTLQQVAQRIEALPTRLEQSNVAAATSILAGLILEKGVIQQILREEIMRDSVIYQDILEQGLQRGRQEGRQEGLQEGRQEGLQEGERSLILKLLARRLGALPSETIAQVEALSLEQLEALGEALLDFTQLADFTTWLEQNTALG